MNEADWWKTLFDQKYFDTYSAELTPERTSQEVDFVIKATQLKPADQILDLACGHGRHSIELARRGFYNITGLDYSQVFLEKAKKDAQTARVNTKFVRGDMKKLPFKEKFDMVMMMFTAFGYFSNEENQHVLEEVGKTLKPGGKFLLDVTNIRRTTKRQVEQGEKLPSSNTYRFKQKYEVKGLVIDEVCDFDLDTQLYHIHRRWEEKGEKKEYDAYLIQYTPEQLKQVLEKAGLKFVKLWGDFDFQEQTEESRKTIILAEKAS